MKIKEFFIDLIKTLLFFVQSTILFALHILFHIITKIGYFLGYIVTPAINDFICNINFVSIVIYQGFCELMASFCVFMSGFFIRLGTYFNNQSVKLIQKCW